MEDKVPLEIPRAFSTLADPREDNARHAFIDILTIALFAVVCGADGWVAVVAYAKARRMLLPAMATALPDSALSERSTSALIAHLWIICKIKRVLIRRPWACWRRRCSCA